MCPNDTLMDYGFPTEPRTAHKMGSMHQVVVHGAMGNIMAVNLGNSKEQIQRFTVGQLKEKILERSPKCMGKDDIRLIFTDKMLEKDSDRLSKYGIRDKSVIRTIMRLGGGLSS